MNSIIKTLQYKYALSENGAKDMVRAFAACTFSDLVLMIPAGLLYQFIDTVYTADAPHFRQPVASSGLAFWYAWH